MSLTHDGKSTPILAIDTGGTFTDFLLLHRAELTALKVPSTPADPASAVLTGLRELVARLKAPSPLVIHGSTVATNALLEGRGARVLLITNAGFEDVLEIGRQNRPQLYALSGSRPHPLVARRDRLGISGRMDWSGQELAPLLERELASLSAKLAEAEAIAVVLLHSYANPEHEEAVSRALEDLEIPISLSSRILPEFREYERTATTVANAYVSPRMGSYLQGIGEEVGEERIRIMGSAGGVLTLSRAVDEPVHTVLSGPAGGVVGALDWGRRFGWTNLLSFDMGGTSTDVSLIPDRLIRTREGRVGDLPIAIPLLDIHTVGAGGGSVARIDPGGALRVGPESAGADPGPVAYGKGGSRITVTDAHLWLGRLSPDGLLGGARTLDRNLLASPMEALAEAASTSTDQLAEGIIEVVNTAMERALRVISVERGVDPEGFVLLAFGGAAGLHAVELADRLDLRGVLIPPDPGLLSAFGMLASPIVRDRSRTVLISSDEPEATSRIEAIFEELERESHADFAREGTLAREVLVERRMDARYRDQSFELDIPADGWATTFHDAHEHRYGYRRNHVPVEAVTLRVRLEAPAPPPPVAPAGVRTGSDRSAGTTEVTLNGKRLEVRSLQRDSIPIGDPLAGPLLIREYSSTTWCPPGWLVERSADGTLLLRRVEAPPLTRTPRG